MSIARLSKWLSRLVLYWLSFDTVLILVLVKGLNFLDVFNVVSRTNLWQLSLSFYSLFILKLVPLYIIGGSHSYTNVRFIKEQMTVGVIDVREEIRAIWLVFNSDVIMIKESVVFYIATIKALRLIIRNKVILRGNLLLIRLVLNLLRHLVMHASLDSLISKVLIIFNVKLLIVTLKLHYCPLSLVVFNSIRIEVTIHNAHSTWKWSRSQVLGFSRVGKGGIVLSCWT